jgi:hypothetical protein
MNEGEINKSLKKIIKETLVDTLKDTTTHGIPNILKETNNWILKIIWVICTLGCAGVCFYFINGTFDTFWSYPSYITTEVYQEIPAKFPTVTFCNIKSLSSSDSFTSAYLIKNFQFLNLGLNLTGSKQNDLKEIMRFFPFSDWVLLQNNAVRSFIGNDKNLTKETRKKLGYQIEDMLVSCRFDFKACQPSDFTYFYHSQYGNCYTFNGGVYDNGTSAPIKTSSSTGIIYGLQLELFLGDPVYDLPYDFDSVIILTVDNMTAEPMYQGEILKAETGVETDFIVNRNFISKLPDPYGNCISGSEVNSEYFDYIVNNLGKNYSQNLCFQLCIQNQIIQNCQCASSFLLLYKNDSINYCSAINDIMCSAHVVMNSTFNTICTNMCPSECYSVDHQIKTYKTKYPASSYSDFLYYYLLNKGIKINNTDLSKSCAKINIFYNTMTYTITSQVPKMDYADLFSRFNLYFIKIFLKILVFQFIFSSFGGNLGLFLGMSFLTFVEFFEIGFNCVLISIRYCLAKKKNLVIKIRK